MNSKNRSPGGTACLNADSQLSNAGRSSCSSPEVVGLMVLAQRGHGMVVDMAAAASLSLAFLGNKGALSHRCPSPTPFSHLMSLFRVSKTQTATLATSEAAVNRRRRLSRALYTFLRHSDTQRTFVCGDRAAIPVKTSGVTFACIRITTEFNPVVVVTCPLAFCTLYCTRGTS